MTNGLPAIPVLDPPLPRSPGLPFDPPGAFTAAAPLAPSLPSQPPGAPPMPPMPGPPPISSYTPGTTPIVAANPVAQLPGQLTPFEPEALVVSKSRDHPTCVP